MKLPASSEAQEPAKHPDLRSELFHDLSTRFALELNSNGSLPAAAQKALVESLNSESSTVAEIIAAASKNDSPKEKVGDE